MSPWEADIDNADQPRALFWGDWYTAALVSREFSSRGWSVCTTSETDEAERLLLDGDYDLFVIQWRLPSFNAYDMVHRVRSDLQVSDVKLLVVSEGIGIETEMKLKIYGAIGFMHIPFCGPDFDCFANWQHHQSLPQRKPVPGASVGE